MAIMAIIYEYDGVFTCEECHEKVEDSYIECQHGMFYYDYEREILRKSIPLTTRKYVSLTDPDKYKYVAEVPKLRK